MSGYRPCDIKKALLKKSPNSCPGDDEILYGFLTRLPSTHHLLATMFTMIRKSSTAPDIWASSRITLIHKGGNKDDPTQFRMISLTANVGKLFHTLESKRTMDFMISNEYLDPAAQKAFIEGINGCVEHVQVVQEIIQHARDHKKTVHMTWFDLQDAFGSVSHELIPLVLQHYNLPQNIISYIMNIYSKLQGRVVTKDWQTENFQFKKGVFQGNSYSSTIFLIIFNPLIQYIKMNSEKYGYKLNDKYINTTPFADDFNIISRNKIQHQKFITDIEQKTETMASY